MKWTGDVADTDHVSKPTFPVMPSGVDRRPALSEETARPDPLSGPRPSGGAGARSPWEFVHAATAPPATAGGGATVAEPAPRTGPADAGTDWADDKRLDELFSAWAEAALSADVISERRFMGEEPEATRPDVTEPALAPTEAPALTFASVEDPPSDDALWSSPLDASDPYSSVVAPVPSADLQDCWEPSPAWARGDDDIIPRPRPGGRSRWRR